MRHWMMGTCLLVGVLAGGAVRGQEAMREDLAGTKLPHGEVLLPLPMAPEADQGMLLKVSDGKVVPLPSVEAGETGRDRLQKIMAQRLGDILYPAAGTFIVVAGKVSDLGGEYLYEAAAKELTEPPQIFANPNFPKSLPGTIGGLKDGHVYLIGTVEGKYALVRILKQQANGALVQYVFEPDATLKFAVPRGELSPLQLPAGVQVTNVPELPVDVHMAATQPTVAAALAPKTTVALEPVPRREIILEPVLRTWLLQRQGMVAKRVETIKAPARTDLELFNKAQAMEELGEMNAVEAVDVLIAEISFYNAAARPKQFSIEAFHPAVTALQKIGKPASLAAIKAIGALPLDAPKVEDPLRSVGYRLRLLALVIGGVEGPDVAEFMLNKAVRESDPEHRALYQQAIGYLREP